MDPDGLRNKKCMSKVLLVLLAGLTIYLMPVWEQPDRRRHAYKHPLASDYIKVFTPIASHV